MNKQTTIGKTHFVLELTKKGFSKKEATIAYDAMVDLMFNTLLDNNRVGFKNLCTIIPKCSKPETVKIYGKDVEAGHRIGLSIEQSRSLSTAYKEKHDPDTITNKKMKKLLRKIRK